MSIIITTNEPREIKDLFADAIEDPMDFDMLLLTNRCKLPIERKAIPGDLLASVSDGRLARELRAMREVSQFYVVLLHGTFTYRRDDTLVMRGNKGRNWTKKGVRNLLRTLRYVEGAFLEQAETDEELVQVVNELQEYFDKPYHLSFRSRPALETNWVMPTKEERVLYFYQGIKPSGMRSGVGPILAKALVKRFPNPVDLYQASVDDMASIPRFSKTLAGGIYKFLRGG